MSIDDVQDLTPRVRYTAAASQTTFPYPFPIFAAGDLVVDVDGVTQALDSDYTVDGEGEDTGGDVTFLSGLTAGDIVTIYRDIAIERTTDIQQNGRWASVSINDELDRMTLVDQQLESNIERCLRLPITAAATAAQTLMSPLANWLGKYVFINSSGIPEPATAVSGSVLSQSTIGALLYPQTAAESSAGVTPSSFAYEPGDIRRYGAVSGADSTTAISNAIAANDTVRFPAGTWQMLSGVTKTTENDVTLIFEEGSNIDATSSTDRVGIRLCVGDYDDFDEDDLSSDVAAGDLIVSSPLASSLEVGDIIEILSTDLVTPNFDTVKGEMKQVEMIDGTDIHLDFPLFDSYTAATTVIKRIPGNTVRVQGMKMARDAVNSFCLDVQHAKYVLVDGGSFTGCQESQLRLTKCYSGLVTGVTAIGKPFTTVGPDGTNTQYGVLLLDCQNVVIEKSNIKAGRHGVAIGGTFPSRYNRIVDNVVSNYYIDSPNPGNHALDVHAGDDFVWIERNVVHNGIMCRAANSWITDNRVFQNSDLTTPFNVLINVNTLKTGGNTVIRGNYLKGTGATNQFGIRLTISDENNDFLSAIVTENVSQGVGTFFNVADMESTSSIDYILLANNSARNVSRLSVEVADVGDVINKFVVSDNYLENKGSIEMTGDFVMTGNTLVAEGATRWDFGVAPAGSFRGNVTMLGNVFEGYSADGGLRIDCTYIDKLYIDDNNYSDGTDPNIVGHPRIHIATSRNALGGVSAIHSEAAATAPRHGLWTIRDIVYRRDMAASGFVGWACTTAGYGVRGAWNNATAYAVGQQVTNDTKLYRCVLAGTETGDPGPTHTSGEATTGGGVTWEFISSSFTSAVFKDAGAIAA